MDTKTLERDFRAAFDPLTEGTGDVFGSLMSFFHDDALIVDEDAPFVMDMETFRDHLGFHAGNWDDLQWKPRELMFQVWGSTGVVSCYFTLRGKPKDAGFRQRHGACTLVASWDQAAGRWRGASLHLSPLLTHIHRNSPS